MSVSTDGQICYGILFEEDFAFPWDFQGEDEYRWWRQVNGYKRPFELYDEKGNYINDKEPSDARKVEYYNHQWAWDKVNPLPIKIVNYCSSDAPMYIITLEELFMSNSRGCPKEFNPMDLKVTDEQRQKLIDFCNKYLSEGIKKHNSEEYNEKKIELEPRWYLTSYWG